MGRNQYPAGGETAGGGAPEGVAAAHQQMLADRSLQFDFPALKTPEPPGWARWIGEVLEGVAPLLGYLFWIGVAVAAGLILFMIGREIVSRAGGPARAGPRQTLPTFSLRPTAEQARVLLADADALAERGLFAEAAHLLLLRGVQDIRDQRPGLVQPSLTSRDITALAELPDQARGAFGAIAGVVERSFFGGRPVSDDDWRACRGAFEAFALEGRPS